MGRKSKVNGRMYCANYSKNNLICIICIENAVFKAKGCFKESSDEMLNMSTR